MEERLSKSLFIAGTQCPLMAWLLKYRPNEKWAGDAQQRRLDAGDEFGEKAKGMMGDFIDVTEYIPRTRQFNFPQMVRNTRQAMKRRTKNICEASFSHDGLFCAVDLLHHVEDDVWELYEVKNAPEVKPHHILDAAYQAWILDQCGVTLDGVYVVYHYDDEVDPFEPVDVTEEAIALIPFIEEKVPEIRALLRSGEEPAVTPGEQCEEPYLCQFKRYCARRCGQEEQD